MLMRAQQQRPPLLRAVGCTARWGLCTRGYTGPPSEPVHPRPPTAKPASRRLENAIGLSGFCGIASLGLAGPFVGGPNASLATLSSVVAAGCVFGASWGWLLDDIAYSEKKRKNKHVEGWIASLRPLQRTGRPEEHRVWTAGTKMLLDAYVEIHERHPFYPSPEAALSSIEKKIQERATTSA